jgi:hypothetical protein
MPVLVLLTAVCAVPTNAGSRDVVEFTDGRYLEVRSYTVQGDLIRLDVDHGSFIVIPVASVDEIRRNREIVFSSAQADSAAARRAQAGPGREASEAPRAALASSAWTHLTAGS